MKQTIPIYQVDAFTGTLFRGNPAAVCLLGSWPADRMLQDIAMENNLSETAFLVEEADHWAPGAGLRPHPKSICAATRPSLRPSSCSISSKRATAPFPSPHAAGC